MIATASASQIVLGILHLIGTAGMYVATTFMTVENPSPDTINIVFFCFMLSFFPTVAIVNTVAMSNIADTEKTFPMIRVFGTIGWIAAGLTVSWLGADATIDQFYLAIGASAVMGLYSFTLPNTPPPAKGTPFSASQAIGLDAMSLLKDRSFFVFMIGSFLICIPLAFYYQMAAVSSPMLGWKTRRQNDVGANVRSALHAGFADLLEVVRHQNHAARGHDRLGGSVRHVLLWRR